ncbi:cytoskeleton-associated protein 5 [Hyalella azteca]|uniref:Cytoskeleton-associated protein 5 n=1 Tax=Hyalella azteca TaxID=294128 RepID=A0A8B7NAB8_HYAAZ|nr:cytoskeleton-associated protein 5 [Hyalella azteca]
MEDTEYLKLPLEERCVHKLWKARVNGYEECIKYFSTITDEKSPEFNKFAPLMKKLVTDSNAVAQEKALEAVLAFAENAHIAAKCATDVASGIVAKALGGPRRGTHDNAEAVLLMYCEIEKYAIVQEELIKGFAAKNPKVVVACVKILTSALREFGPKVMAPKPLVKQFPRLLEDRDKNVRDEGKKLMVEMYRWIGDALKPQLTALKPVQVAELETEFEKVAGEKAVQTRFLRSQQELKEKMAAAGDEDAGQDEEDEADGAVEIDPVDLMDPVDILSQLPADFYEKLEAKKWQDRKEAMEILLPLTKHQKLENGDYHDLMKALKKIIAKDTNVMIVALSGQCIAGLAAGLKKKFSVFAVACTETILEKFKEKKMNVVTALREAVDAIYQCTSLESLQETISAALGNKNPNVKAETAAFLGRCFCYCTPTILNKKLIKAFATDLLKTLNESDPTVRDNSAEALAALLKVVGEKLLMPFLGDLDNLKMQKIKEASEKVELKVKIPTAKAKAKPAPAAAPSKPVTVSSGGRVAATAARPAPAKAPPRKAKPPGGAGGGGSAATKSPAVVEEAEMVLEAAVEAAGEVLGAAVVSQLADPNWKERLAAMDAIVAAVSEMDTNAPCQAMVLVIAVQKPGLKDNNFQVLKLRITAIQTLAENTKFSRTSCEACLAELVDKLGDLKNGSLASSCLTAMAEAVSLEWLGPEVTTLAFKQKSPKVQEAALVWLAQAVTDFGLIVKPKSVIADIKKGLAHTNPGVRNAAVSLCGVIHLHMGPALRTFLEDEKPALLQQIDAEIEKQTMMLARFYAQNKGRTAPAPTRKQRTWGGAGRDARGGAGGARGGTVDDDDEGGEEDEPTSEDVANSNVQDLIPRTNIAALVTDELIAELADKNWKVRSEALSKISGVISSAKFITADWGDLPGALAARLNDTNKNLAVEALKVVGQLAAAAGPHCSRHTRTVIPGVLLLLGDAKVNVRASAQSVLESWAEQAKPKELLEGDTCVDALKSGTVFLKAALFPWLAQQLTEAPPKSLNKEDLGNYVPHIYSGLEDRSAEVRKAATEAVLPFMLHLGYEGMLKHTSRVKPASKNALMATLDKARLSLPAKPAPTVAAARQAPAKTAGKMARPQTGGGAVAPAAAAAKKPSRAATAPPASSRKGGDDQDTSPLLPVNGLKQQRASDEQKLKVLRWDFTTPRQEFITQLNDQMMTAGLNRTLITNMFHKDFNFHKKSIDALNEDLADNLEACVCNLDMILRWMSLRFFDTNPSVIMKAMEYLTNVFTYLSDDGYRLMDFEAYSFLPFIVQKFGDPKDGIRGPARNIVRLIVRIYPASKVSPYLMEGLKNKNARQRAECLEALEDLIRHAGMTVCQPSPAVALKDIAKQISDKDKVVRNAALNALVQVYFIEGEKLYKYIGQLSSKDMGFLEERIKQAGKNRQEPTLPTPAVEFTPTVRSGGGGAPRGGNRVVPSPAGEFNPLARGAAAALESNAAAGQDVNSLLQRYRQRAPSNNSDSGANKSAFTLDYSVVEKLLEDDDNKPIKVEVESIPDLNSLMNFNTICPTLTSRLAQPGFTTLSRTNANLEAEDASEAINLVISQVSSSSPAVVVRALCQLDEVICSTDQERWQQLVPHVDQLLVMATVQYRLVLNTKMNDPGSRGDCVKIYRALTNCLMTIFNRPELAVVASRDVMSDVWHVLLSTLIDARLAALDEGAQIIRAFNVLVVRMAEKADFTSVFSASLKLLHDCVGAGGSGGKFGELVLKCNWKIIQMLSKRTTNLDLTVILTDVHHFLTSYPMNTWMDRSDVPLRTIKTVIHTLCKIYGSAVLPHLDSIKGAHGSDLHKYITKTLKKVGHEGSGDVAKETSVPDNQNLLQQHNKQHQLAAAASHATSKSPKRLSKAANNSLSEIFRKIGSKENTKEGLVELYEFQQMHPEADISPFLSKASLFFQNYIERGLKKVKMEREMKSSGLSTQLGTETNSNAGPLSSIQVSTEAQNASFNMNELVDEFKTLASKAGFDNTYIASAVKDICSSEKSDKVKDYNKLLQSVSSINKDQGKE